MQETVTRRVVWLTDSEWAALNARAKREGVNVSNLIRRLSGQPEVKLDRFGSSKPAPKRR